LQNNEVTDVVSKISETYDCRAVEGMLSYQMEKDTIDGKKTIIQNPTEKQRLEHEKVFDNFIEMSTHLTKIKQLEASTTISI